MGPPSSRGPARKGPGLHISTDGQDGMTTAVEVEEKKHGLLFTQSFLQPSSSNYQHKHLLPVGKFPSTPKLNISYVDMFLFVFFFLFPFIFSFFLFDSRPM